jgi:hypothetical protein
LIQEGGVDRKPQKKSVNPAAGRQQEALSGGEMRAKLKADKTIPEVPRYLQVGHDDRSRVSRF